MNIDWMQLCLNLRSNYKPLSQIAKEVGSDWKHLCRLARGEVQQPKFDVAMKLLDLHYDYCFDKHRNV
jgi:hypothetical protein